MSLFEEIIESHTLQMLIEDKELEGLQELVNVGFAGVIEFEKGEPFVITVHPFMKEFGSRQVELLGLNRKELLKRLAGIYRSIAFYFHEQEEKEQELAKKTALRRQEVGALRRAWTYFLLIGEHELASAIIGEIHEDLATMGFGEEAKEMLNKIIPKLEQVKDKGWRLRNLAGLMSAERKNQEAINNYKKALALFEKVDDKEGLSACFNDMGLLYYHQGNLDQAEKLYKESLSISEELKNESGIAASLHNLAMIHVARGNFHQALKSLQYALEIHEKRKSPGRLAATFVWIGNVYLRQRNYPKALEAWQRSVALYQDLGDDLGVAEGMSNIAIVLNEEGEFMEAIRTYEKALKIFQKHRQPSQIASVLGAMGNCLVCQKKYSEAMELYKRSLRINEEINDLKGVAINHLNIGIILEETKDFKGALSEFIQSFSRYLEMKHDEARSPLAGIKRVREQVGKEKFMQYWREITGEEKLPEWLSK